MKSSSLALAAVAGLLFAPPVVAQVPGGAGVAETANSPTLPSSEKVICRSTKLIGTRVKSQRVCKTAAQWRADIAEQRRTVEKGQAERTTLGN